MKSIDTYLCKEKKSIAGVDLNKRYYVSINTVTNKLEILGEADCLSAKNRKIRPDYGLLVADEGVELAPLKWPLRLAVAALLALTIYEVLSL